MPINLTTIFEDYPAVSKSFNGCSFGAPFTHLNELFNYPTRTKYPILAQPKPCSTKKPNDILIIIGVKSLPAASDGRNALRKTWVRLPTNNHLVLVAVMINTLLKMVQ